MASTYNWLPISPTRRMSNPSPSYSRTNPFLAPISERYHLSRPGSRKETQHLVIKLTGSGLNYKVGDSLAIYPKHDPQIVAKILKTIGASGDEPIIDARTEESFSLFDYLSEKVNISRVSKKLLTALHDKYPRGTKKDELARLIDAEGRELLKAYGETHELWDTLAGYSGAKIEPQELCSLLSPLLPRFYSIASSQKTVGEEAHLTVAVTEYMTNGHLRHGVASHYLCHLAKVQERLPVYLQPAADFTVPEDHARSIIMVGPGTGIASFRAFMQEREATGAIGKNWLFFGEWTRADEFYYEDYWKALVDAGKLKLDLAFSRDQAEKVYVQHKMLSSGAELWKWLEEGASFFVCGDADHMAKDVDAALHHIIKEHGALSDDAAKAYVKQLRTEKRYLRDVY